MKPTGQESCAEIALHVERWINTKTAEIKSTQESIRLTSNYEQVIKLAANVVRISELIADARKMQLLACQRSFTHLD